MTGALASFRAALAFGRPHLLLRHAERHPIDDPTEGWDVRLTEQGRVAAAELGRQLAGSGPFVLRHSPVPRCGETADALAEGIREAGGRARLGGVLEPLAGPYLRNPLEAMAAARDLGHRFVRAWFSDQLPSDLIDGRAASARSQLIAMVGGCTDGGSGQGAASGCAESGLYVSHDWNLLAVREEYFDLRHEEAGWPDFLDGVALVVRDDGLMLTYGERCRELSLASLASLG